MTTASVTRRRDENLEGRGRGEKEGGTSGEALLQITIAEDLLAAFEWVEEGKPYREWLVPAAVLNEAATVRLLDD